MIVFTLFSCKKGPETSTVKTETNLMGAWHGKYEVKTGTPGQTFVIVLKAKGKMEVYEGDINSGDMAKGTFMIEGSKLYGNFQFIQDGPVTNIEAQLNTTNDIMSGAWYCGNDGGAFVADKPLTHSAALQPGSPKQPL